MQAKVELERTGPVGHLILNRPGKMNAIDTECLELIEQRLAEAEGDAQIRALVVRGEGKAFCAGADLAAIEGLADDPDAFAVFLERWHEAFSALERSPLPTVAAVHGVALAGGFELLQVCDVVVLSEEAQIGDQHANYGLFPGGGSTQRLPRLIGERRAKWLLLSGTWIEAQAALTAGLVNEVVPSDEVFDRAVAMAELLAERSPLLTARIKQTIRLGLGTDLATALELERPLALAHMQSEDARIGLDAFRERTKPDFVGR